MKRSNSSMNFTDFYPNHYEEEALIMEARIKEIIDLRIKKSARLIGGLVCSLFLLVILIVLLKIIIIGTIISVFLLLSIGYLVFKYWIRKRIRNSGYSKENKYKVRLSNLNFYVKRLIKSKISLSDFQGILEKVFEEFLPGILMEAHSELYSTEINEFIKFLKSESVHSCLLNAAVRLELSIDSLENPVIISARLRKFFIPLIHLLKEIPENSGKELEIVNRILGILSKDNTQLLMKKYKATNDLYLKSLTLYWSLIESSKHLYGSCSFLTDIDTYFNPYANRRLTPKVLLYRRYSFNDSFKTQE